MILVEKKAFLMGWCMYRQLVKRIKWPVLPLMALVLIGCATPRVSQSQQEADRIIELRKEIYARYGSCLRSVWNDPANADFWAKTATSLKDPRKLDLLTLNTPITKAYREKARAVAKEWLACDAEAYASAKQITPAYAKSLGVSTSYQTEVYVDVIQGKYKTYAEVNKALFAAMQKADDDMQAANSKLADDFLASSKAESAAEQQRRAEAVMMWGAMSQGFASGYQNSVQSNKINAPSTTNCRQIGAYMSCTTN